MGHTLQLNGAAYTIVGVAPQSFTGLDVGIRPEVWVPMAMNRQVRAGLNWYEERRGLFVFTVGRLKPTVSKDQALAQLTTIADRLEKEYPNDNESRSVTVVPLAQATINPDARQGVVAATALLMTIVGLVLLIACANVSNLLLGRALERRREIAVRLAIGASRMRLIRQLLTESLALAVPSAALGVLIAYWARGVLLSLLPPLPGISLSLHLDLDWRVLGFTMLLGLGAGFLFGLAPALQASKPDVLAALKDQDQTGGVDRRRLGIRDLLVVGQVALSLVALVGAGLFLRSLEATRKTDPGFETKNLLSVGFDLDLQGYDQEKGEAFLRQLVERVETLPGVVSASYAATPPLSFALSRSVFLEGGNESDRTLISVNTVGPRYFETLGIRVVQGRPLDRGRQARRPQGRCDQPDDGQEALAEGRRPRQALPLLRRRRALGRDRGDRQGREVHVPGRGSAVLHLRGPRPALLGSANPARAHRHRPPRPAHTRGARAQDPRPGSAAPGPRDHRARA